MKPIESKRVALDRKIILRFPDFDGFVAEYAANLSMTGMFVRSKEPQKAGTPVSFELRLEDGSRLVRGSGWVVWSRAEREAADRPAGMGIEFTELDQKSRRLVRWMILSQLPEDEEPFEVHAGTASAPATLRLVSQAAARRSRRAGVFTAVAIFSALAALAYWGYRTRSGSHPPVAAQAPVVESSVARFDHRAQTSEETADEAVAALRGVDQQTGRPVGERQLEVRGPNEANEEDAIAAVAAVAAVANVESVVRSWAKAWSEQDVDWYLSHYAADFSPANGLSPVEWRDQRRRRVSSPESIRVGVARLETRLLPEERARVSFLQSYRSDGYADTVDKVLFLVRGEGGWKIRREVTD